MLMINYACTIKTSINISKAQSSEGIFDPIPSSLTSKQQVNSFPGFFEPRR